MDSVQPLIYTAPCSQRLDPIWAIAGASTRRQDPGAYSRSAGGPNSGNRLVPHARNKP